MTDHAPVDPVLLAGQGGHLLQAGHVHQGLVALLVQVGQLVAVHIALPRGPAHLLLQPPLVCRPGQGLLQLLTLSAQANSRLVYIT